MARSTRFGVNWKSWPPMCLPDQCGHGGRCGDLAGNRTGRVGVRFSRSHRREASRKSSGHRGPQSGGWRSAAENFRFTGLAISPTVEGQGADAAGWTRRGSGQDLADGPLQSSHLHWAVLGDASARGISGIPGHRWEIEGRECRRTRDAARSPYSASLQPPAIRLTKAAPISPAPAGAPRTRSLSNVRTIQREADKELTCEVRREMRREAVFGFITPLVTALLRADVA